ncbi:arginine--tRNA ligase [Patescibacteria group bacterium]|nr:arginine--tRNA ligase [Patescibacteria group bacterium]
MVAEQIRQTLQELVEIKADFSVERPKNPEHGDFASNVAMVVAKKQNGVNPKSLAEQLQEKLSNDERFTAVEVAGPGFLNFRMAPSVWQTALADILKAKEKYGTLPKNDQKIQVEFISANPTGPLTLGNGRGGFGGDVLSRVLQRAGYDVNKEYYLNDAGSQIVGLGETLKGKAEIYKGEYIEELKSKVKLDGSDLVVGQRAAALMLSEIQDTVDRMGIQFDSWFSEREELHESGEIDRTLADLEKVDATYEKDDALWLKSTHFDDDEDRVIRKADGELTYLASDLAHFYGQFVKGKVDLSLLVVGADHHGYVKRMEAGVEFLRKAEHFDGQLKILITQLVRLIKNGEEMKMSKRAGTYVTLDELLALVEVDVARFFFVMKGFDTHMDFDLDLATEQSQKNPVYRFKYAHARISSILKKAGRHGSGKLELLEHPAEQALIRELSEFPSVIARTAKDYQVQRLPHYSLELADVFHKFYEQCPVISEDKDMTAARLQLLDATKVVMNQVADTIGISLPEKM